MVSSPPRSKELCPLSRVPGGGGGSWRNAAEGVWHAPRAEVRYTRGIIQKASGDHPQAFGNPRQSGLLWASSPGNIPRNIRKVRHRATTPPVCLDPPQLGRVMDQGNADIILRYPPPPYTHTMFRSPTPPR